MQINLKEIYGHEELCHSVLSYFDHALALLFSLRKIENNKFNKIEKNTKDESKVKRMSRNLED